MLRFSDRIANFREVYLNLTGDVEGILPNGIANCNPESLFALWASAVGKAGAVVFL